MDVEQKIQAQPMFCCLLDDVLVYVLNFLTIQSIMNVQKTCKSLYKQVHSNEQSYHHFDIRTLEKMFKFYMTEPSKITQTMSSFTSIRCLKTAMNVNNILPLHELIKNEKYQSNPIFKDVPPPSFYESYVSQFLSQLYRLESLSVEGCFDQIIRFLPKQPRLKQLSIRNHESCDTMSHFIQTMLAMQYNFNTNSSDNDNNTNKFKKEKFIPMWCGIMEKVIPHQLQVLKLQNFVFSQQTCAQILKFENLNYLQIHYNGIECSDDIKGNVDLMESLQFFNDKNTMLCNAAINTKELCKIEPLIALMFSKIHKLHSVHIHGDETIIKHNGLTLIFIYYCFLYHAMNLKTVKLRLAFSDGDTHSREMVHLYHKILNQDFEFYLQNLNEIQFVLTSSELQLTDESVSDRRSSITTNPNQLDLQNMDIDDIIMQYGFSIAKEREYVYLLPYPIQVLCHLCDAMNSNTNKVSNEIHSRYFVNEINVMFDTATANADRSMGYLLAKAMLSLRPKKLVIMPTLFSFGSTGREFMIKCLLSMAKWTKFLNERNNTFLNSNNDNKKHAIVEQLSITTQCLETVFVKDLHDFCIGSDGTDLRLMNALEICCKDLAIKEINLTIETIQDKNDYDKLKWYMDMEKQAKKIGFKMDLKFEENTQKLIYCYHKKNII